MLPVLVVVLGRSDVASVGWDWVMLCVAVVRSGRMDLGKGAMEELSARYK